MAVIFATKNSVLASCALGSVLAAASSKMPLKNWNC